MRQTTPALSTRAEVAELDMRSLEIGEGKHADVIEGPRPKLLELGPPYPTEVYIAPRKGRRTMGERMMAGEAARRVDIDAILARHGPAEPRNHLSVEAVMNLASVGSTPIEAAVVVGDLRMSGLLIKEAVSASLFARYIIGFTEAVRSLATDSQGWFDKFTGDGFIAFWVYKTDEAIVDTVPGFCQSILPAAESLISNLKRNSRNFPIGVGLSIGIDSGPCELVRVGDSLTLVGSPIVGATRMVSGARAGQALVNVSLGAALERQKSRLESTGILIERTVVKTKEYPEGQEAYELDFGNGPGRMRSHRGIADSEPLTPPVGGTGTE